MWLHWAKLGGHKACPAESDSLTVGESEEGKYPQRSPNFKLIEEFGSGIHGVTLLRGEEELKL